MPKKNKKKIIPQEKFYISGRLFLACPVGTNVISRNTSLGMNPPLKKTLAPGA